MSSYEEREERADDRERMERGLYGPFEATDDTTNAEALAYGATMRAELFKRHPHLDPANRFTRKATA